LREYYNSAESFLAQSQCPDADVRLGQCARAILTLGESRADDLKTPIVQYSVAAELTLEENGTSGQEQRFGSAEKWEACSLENEVLRYEGELIQRALEAASGSVTRAARMLRITHQGLAFILNGRHKNLLTVRTPVRRRRKSIFRSQ